MSSGPTQNYDDPGLDRWHPRPALARVVNVGVYVAPPALAIGVGWLASTFVPASRLGMNPWLWLAAEVALSTGLVLLLGKATRRLLPLRALLKMALVFPDQAPSRLSLARRTHSPAALRRRVQAIQARGLQPGTEAARTSELLALVAALSVHDYATRGHSERVQGYAALIAEQMKLSDEDAAKLRWAALLHDIGKLRVPSRILNKRGRPTDSEWKVLTTHPHAGLDLVAPLADYLGDWVNAISQHHERWDGQGYPLRLAGQQIHLGARIIAVADTYDVITSTRSYKDAMPASQARAELTRCAGTQFDPVVVRAFLEVGLGKLRMNAGPLSALTSLPGFRSVPLPDVGTVGAGLGSALSSGSAVATAALGLLVAAVAAPAAAQTPPASAQDDVVVSAPSAEPTGAAPVGGGDVASPVAAPVPGSDPTAVPDPASTQTPPADDAAPQPSADPQPSAEPTDAAQAQAPVDEAAAQAPPPAAAPAPTPAPSATSGSRSQSADCRAVSRDELGRCTLAGATLVGDWSRVDLSGQDLHGATLALATFDRANFTGANLSGVKGGGASFDRATFTGANLSGAKLTAVSFRQADLTGANLSHAALTSGSLRDAVLDRAQIDGLDVSSASLAHTSFKDAAGTPTTSRRTTFDHTVCPNGSVSSSSCW